MLVTVLDTKIAVIPICSPENAHSAKGLHCFAASHTPWEDQVYGIERPFACWTFEFISNQWQVQLE